MRHVFVEAVGIFFLSIKALAKHLFQAKRTCIFVSHLAPRESHLAVNGGLDLVNLRLQFLHPWMVLAKLRGEFCALRFQCSKLVAQTRHLWIVSHQGDEIGILRFELAHSGFLDDPVGLGILQVPANLGQVLHRKIRGLVCSHDVVLLLIIRELALRIPRRLLESFELFLQPDGDVHRSIEF